PSRGRARAQGGRIRPEARSRSSGTELVVEEAATSKGRNQRDALWLFRRQESRVCDHDAENPLPVDQLSRIGEFLRARLAPCRGLLLLPRRPPAASDALPLQQRPDRRRRPLLLYK